MGQSDSRIKYCTNILIKTSSPNSDPVKNKEGIDIDRKSKQTILQFHLFFSKESPKRRLHRLEETGNWSRFEYS